MCFSGVMWVGGVGGRWAVGGGRRGGRGKGDGKGRDALPPSSSLFLHPVYNPHTSSATVLSLKEGGPGGKGKEKEEDERCTERTISPGGFCL